MLGASDRPSLEGFNPHGVRHNATGSLLDDPTRGVDDGQQGLAGSREEETVRDWGWGWGCEWGSVTRQSVASCHFLIQG